MNANTLLLRLEGPMQSWGGHESKFVIRRSGDAPTKSGIVGLLCSAMGISRPAGRQQLPRFNALLVGVRIDRPGVRWWDYHTIGAGIGMMTAEGKVKTGAKGTLLTRREYLCDASFLVALQGDPGLLGEAREALLHPVWPIFLGRKSCPPSLPLLGRDDEPDTGDFPDLSAALRCVPWRPRLAGDDQPETLECLLEWQPSEGQAEAPSDAEVWYDVAQSFDVPGHHPRLVVRARLTVGDGKDVYIGSPRQSRTPAPPRPHADYGKKEYTKKRDARMEADQGLCVFCKAPAKTVHHITYRLAGGGEEPEHLRSLCRLCHDAVTMIEYGQGMGLDRINPEEPEWRSRIISKRDEIIAFRSMETRRRRLAPEEVE